MEVLDRQLLYAEAKPLKIVDYSYRDLEANPGQGPGSPNLQPDVTSTREKMKIVTQACEWAHHFSDLIQDNPSMVYPFRKWVKGVRLTSELFLFLSFQALMPSPSWGIHDFELTLLDRLPN